MDAIHCSLYRLCSIVAASLVLCKRWKASCLKHCTFCLVRCSVKDGTVGDDHIYAGGVAKDGSVILAGGTTGGYAAESAGSFDFLVIKLNEDGEVLWTWQVRDRFVYAWIMSSATSVSD